MANFFAKGRGRVILTMTILLAVLVLQSFDETASRPNIALAQSVPQVSPQLKNKIGQTDCLSSKGFGLQNADFNLMAQLQTAVGGSAHYSCHITTGKVRFFSTSSSSPAAVQVNSAGQVTPEQVARTFLSTYGPIFGLKDQAVELNVESTLPSKLGNNFVRFQQVFNGVPVLAGEIVVQVNAKNGIISVGGELSPDPQLAVTPQVNASGAKNEAINVISKVYNSQPGNLSASQPELLIYNSGLLESLPASFNRLVWRMTVLPTGGAFATEPFEELVLVDAATGSVVLHFNQVAEARDRRICNLNNTSYASGSEPDCVAPVRTEGQTTTSVADVDLAYDYSGATYDFYFNNFGRDSLDGSGLPLKNSVKLCENGYTCPYANAFWSPAKQQMYYGANYASADDVVGHELTHGFTSFTSNLLYYYQSGAINESMSDVFGEFVDQTDGVDGAAGSGAANRWLIAEDLPIGAIRSMKNPPTYSHPDKISSSYYATSGSDSGGVHTNSGVNNKAAYLIVDGTVAEPGGAFNGQTITGIGIPKAAQIYYEVETHLLTSASDYQDLYDFLPQACLNLVNQHGITTGDCDQVQKAVIATEMNLTPATFYPEAPICAAGQSPNNVFFDDMENPASGKWAFAASVGSNAWSYSTFPYNTSGTHHLAGADLASTSDSTATMTTGVVLPANAYMHFKHYYFFQSGLSYDGSVLEYTTDDGSNWLDTGSLFDTNGYNGSIYIGNGNPLGGRSAFTYYSKGYYSSRLNLSTLAGQTVKFRYRVGSDYYGGTDGWWIDDMRIYTCSNQSNCLIVISSADDGSCGTLRMALTVANNPAAIVKSIDMTTLSPGTTIQIQGNSLIVGPGVTITGPSCTDSGPVVTISGTGISGPGLTLNGATLNNVKVTGFGGPQIQANPGRNTLFCVKAVH